MFQLTLQMEIDGGFEILLIERIRKEKYRGINDVSMIPVFIGQRT